MKQPNRICGSKNFSHKNEGDILINILGTVKLYYNFAFKTNQRSTSEKFICTNVLKKFRQIKFIGISRLVLYKHFLSSLTAYSLIRPNPIRLKYKDRLACRCTIPDICSDNELPIKMRNNRYRCFVIMFSDLIIKRYIHIKSL